MKKITNHPIRIEVVFVTITQMMFTALSMMTLTATNTADLITNRLLTINVLIALGMIGTLIFVLSWVLNDKFFDKKVLSIITIGVNALLAISTIVNLFASLN